MRINERKKNKRWGGRVNEWRMPGTSTMHVLAIRWCHHAKVAEGKCNRKLIYSFTACPAVCVCAERCGAVIAYSVSKKAIDFGWFLFAAREHILLLFLSLQLHAYLPIHSVYVWERTSSTLNRLLYFQFTFGKSHTTDSRIWSGWFLFLSFSGKYLFTLNSPLCSKWMAS